MLFLLGRFGRRFATLLCLFDLLLFGVGAAFSPNIYVYMILKFFCGTSAGVCMMNATVLGRYTVHLWLKTGFIQQKYQK